MKTVYLDVEALAKYNFDHPGLQKESPVANGALLALKVLLELKDIEIWVVSSTTVDEALTREWLAKNYPALKSKLIFLAANSSLEGDVLVTLDSSWINFSGKVYVFDFRNPFYEWGRYTWLFSDLSQNSMNIGVYCVGYSVYLSNRSNTAIKKITLFTSRNEFCDEGAAVTQSNDMVFENIPPKGQVEIYDNNMYRQIFVDIVRVEWADGQVQENLSICS